MKRLQARMQAGTSKELYIVVVGSCLTKLNDSTKVDSLYLRTKNKILKNSFSFEDVLAAIGHDLEYLRNAIESAAQKEDDKRFKTKYYFENIFTSDQIFTDPKLNLTLIKLKGNGFKSIRQKVII